MPVEDPLVESFLERLSEVTGVGYNSVSVVRLPVDSEGSEVELSAEDGPQRDVSCPVFVFSLSGTITVKFTGRHRGRRLQKLIADREIKENCGISIQESVLRQRTNFGSRDAPV